MTATMNVRLPDGTLIKDVPDDVTDEQIRAVYEPMGHKFDALPKPQFNDTTPDASGQLPVPTIPGAPTPPPYEENKGFLDRVGEDLSKRRTLADTISKANILEEQNPISGAAQYGFGVVGGGLNDIIGEAVHSGYDTLKDVPIAGIKPSDVVGGLQKVGGYLGQAGDAVGDTSLGKAAAESGYQLKERYDNYLKEHPEAARNIDAAGNLLGLTANLEGVGGLAKPTATAIREVAPAIGRGVATVADKTIGAAGRYVGGGVKNMAIGATARTPEVLKETGNAIKSDAVDLRNKMRDAGAILTPSSSNGLLATVTADVNKQRFIPSLNPKTQAVLEDLTSYIKENNGNIDLDQLDQYRRHLSRIGASEDGVSAGAARKAIDNFVNDLTDTSLVNGGKEAVDYLNQFRKDYATGSKFEDISDILTKADGDPNKIKSGLKKFLDSGPKGYSSEELAALKEASRNSFPERILRGVGTFGFDIGKAKNIALPALAAGGGLYVPGGIPLVTAGTVARQGHKLIAKGKAENLLRVIEGSAAKPTLKTIIPKKSK